MDEKLKALLEKMRVSYPLDYDQSDDYNDGFGDGIDWAIDQIKELYK